MARIVKKFGGTSIGDISRIKTAAQRVKEVFDQGSEVLVVVSAMSGWTDQVSGYCREMSSIYDAREYDSVVSSGEQITAGLMSIALQDLGINSRSWNGWQIPIKTTSEHSNASIVDIDTTELEKRMTAREVPVVTGFQGIGPNNRITTLGKGGSDLTAVAMAAALGAERCDIYTDVAGIYRADPRIVPFTTRHKKISFEEMLEMSILGAKVLHYKSVDLAMKMGVPLQVLSSFENVPGTLIVGHDEMFEKDTISGIVLSANESKITLEGVKDEPGTVAAILAPLAGIRVKIGMIIQDVSKDGRITDVTFTVDRARLDEVEKLLNKAQPKIGFSKLTSDPDVVKVSVVGVAIQSNTERVKVMFDALAKNGINILAISTSEIKISVLVSGKFSELAVRTLHTAYGLDMITK
ncbi:MAG: aspartate kinase [Sphingomonadales bacterium]